MELNSVSVNFFRPSIIHHPLLLPLSYTLNRVVMSWYSDPTPIATGYWGPVTSTLLWCEEKYRFSPYIAEPVNTITNLFFIALSLYGYTTTQREKLGLRYSICHLGVTLVGLGSAAFHATLKHSTQLLDELPMIYASAWLTWCVCETSPKGTKPRFRLLLPLGLVAMVSWITIVYVRNGNPVFHQVAYAFIQLLSTSRVVYLLTSTNSPYNNSASTKQKKTQIQNLYLFGAAIFLLGFAIWNLDNIFCYHLRQSRNKIGYPWAILLEGHGWWHILTGWGAYCLITAGNMLAVGLKEGVGAVELEKGAFPVLRRVKDFKPTKRHKKSD